MFDGRTALMQIKAGGDAEAINGRTAENAVQPREIRRCSVVPGSRRLSLSAGYNATILSQAINCVSHVVPDLLPLVIAFGLHCGGGLPGPCGGAAAMTSFEGTREHLDCFSRCRNPHASPMAKHRQYVGDEGEPVNPFVTVP
jgi:hypothetical protein